MKMFTTGLVSLIAMTMTCASAQEAAQVAEKKPSALKRAASSLRKAGKGIHKHTIGDKSTVENADGSTTQMRLRRKIFGKGHVARGTITNADGTQGSFRTVHDENGAATKVRIRNKKTRELRKVACQGDQSKCADAIDQTMGK
ncbi:MAG: hypothetical protein JNL01_01645 [Bdellovibrionales bacterium]|nr:hypothetical protein [Bdellovibrionales bacterium]